MDCLVDFLEIMNLMDKCLNLRGTPCPLNFVRCCLELEHLINNQRLQVDIDKGDPEEMVLLGLRDKGYKVQIIINESDWIRFIVTS